MITEELMKSISVKNPAKMLMLVIDGLGGLPIDGKTELEQSHIPNLDKLASKSVCGLADPISPGITPGSGPSHLALFGYDPINYQIGRGVLEALGIGIQLTEGDLAARGNFAKMDEKGIIVDRRAGRISTKINKALCDLLQNGIEEIEGVKITINPGKEHRFVIVFTGEGLGDGLTDADPQKDGKPRIPTSATSDSAKFSERVINLFIEEATQLLKSQDSANTVLLRGFSQVPKIPTLTELFKIHPAAIAVYPMYKGIARLVGMDVLNTGEGIRDEIKTLRNFFDQYDFFYLHIKDPDMFGEDANFDGKVRALEKVDEFIPDLLDLEPDVLVITGDHSTPSLLKSHSWHPNPILIFSKFIRTDSVERFDERSCLLGGLGRIPATDIMPLMLANALKLKKYGA
ncbi:MAG: 2,3-bisphosphoglycerate-independent phosphoglycerate mutase [Syntrophobacterales bacterium]|nr:MAG: 2,3-bisphosphoglycerate-independent phosphoglycerate mutase [Syntrophobacterales bacterium]